jgi:predicted kinase
MQTLYLIRGIPGSGKTTEAKKIVNETGALHFEADMFFERNGPYKFDPTQIRAAHQWCQASAKKALSEGKSVVVSNTFVKQWEMAAYLNMATELGVEVNIRTMNGKYKNVHGVPQDKVNQMAENFEH